MTIIISICVVFLFFNSHKTLEEGKLMAGYKFLETKVKKLCVLRYAVD